MWHKIEHAPKKGPKFEIAEKNDIKIEIDRKFGLKFWIESKRIAWKLQIDEKKRA